MSAEYEILVCPVCRVQISEDYETGGYCYDHCGAEAVAVSVTLDPAATPALALAAYRYQELRRDEDWRIASQRYVNSLTDAERREYLGPSGYAFDSILRSYLRETAEQMAKSPFKWMA
jgi:hypothetical protein